MKKVIFYIYAVAMILFFGYMGIVLGIFTTDDPKATILDGLTVGMIVFGVPVMFLVWLPMKFYCRFKNRKNKIDNNEI